MWDNFGSRAGAMRNENMLLLAPDLVVAFPGGPGTAHMVRIAKRNKIRVIESPR
jgi:predicted Rossmann-fold nucleotide-binding protein